uniref:Uncharacterized protein n=1 Tax=Rhizophora mucronata TaxID=61149 RepID=A0A2P2QYE9_RHIMU
MLDTISQLGSSAIFILLLHCFRHCTYVM